MRHIKLIIILRVQIQQIAELIFLHRQQLRFRRDKAIMEEQLDKELRRITCMDNRYQHHLSQWLGPTSSFPLIILSKTSRQTHQIKTLEETRYPAIPKQEQNSLNLRDQVVIVYRTTLQQPQTNRVHMVPHTTIIQ